MKQTEINKMIELLKNNPDWMKGDTRKCNIDVDREDEYLCKGCPIISRKKPHYRIYTRGTIHCGDSFLIKLNRMKEEDKLEILTAAL